MIINVLFFIASYVIEDVFRYNLVSNLGMKYVGSVRFNPIQIFTHMFLHAGFAHILFNMFGLLMFGSMIERYIGTPKFLALYLLSGLGAAFLEQAYWGYHIYQYFSSLFPSEALQNNLFAQGNALKGVELATARRLITPMVGASGAVYGLLAAYALFFPNAKLMLLFFPYPIKAKFFVPGIMVLDLYMGISNHSWDNIAHFAHLGGGLTGLLLILYWKNNRLW